MKQYTDMTVLLDRSGSMFTIKEAMETAFNTMIKENQAVPSTKVTLIQFDDRNDHDVIYQCVPVGAVERLNLEPRGNTPLIDAFVKAIDRTGERLRNMRESERPDQVLMVVITDGQENASRVWKKYQLSDKVMNQRGQFNWQFTYLGANQDAINEAASYGIPKEYAYQYWSNAGSTIAMGGAMGINTVSYASNSANQRGNLQAYTEAQRKLAEIDEETNKTKTPNRQ